MRYERRRGRSSGGSDGQTPPERGWSDAAGGWDDQTPAAAVPASSGLIMPFFASHASTLNVPGPRTVR